MMRPVIRQRLARVVLVLLLVLGGILLYLLPYQDLPRWIAQLGETTSVLGWSGPLLFGVATAIMTGVGVPRLLMTGVAAAMFGVLIGLLCSLLGTLAGAYATFLVARWSGQEAGLSRWPRLRRFSGLLSRQGVVPVLLARQLPLSSFFINLLLGLTAVRTRDFLLGSSIGFLPEAIPAALIGAGLVTGDLAGTLKYLLAGVIIFVVSAYLLRRFLRSRGSGLNNDVAEPPAEGKEID
ncbi:MAG: TVP38/TMEM64 family protein [Gammaproteobacteria bacterium]|nr:TVP38/TMEM64 family protein [Gammaproteobacteria bacterium]